MTTVGRDPIVENDDRRSHHLGSADQYNSQRHHRDCVKRDPARVTEPDMEPVPIPTEAASAAFPFCKREIKEG